MSDSLLQGQRHPPVNLSYYLERLAAC